MSRRLALALAGLAVIAGGCSKGKVSNDDSVSRKAAERTVERFLTAIHEGAFAGACAQLPGRQRGGLARLSASRGGPATCAGALRTLAEFAPVRASGRLSFKHDIGFRNSLPHKSRAAVDDVTVAGHTLGSIGLRRDGDSWSVAVVCDCP